MVFFAIIGHVPETTQSDGDFTWFICPVVSSGFKSPLSNAVSLWPATKEIRFVSILIFSHVRS